MVPQLNIEDEKENNKFDFFRLKNNQSILLDSLLAKQKSVRIKDVSVVPPRTLFVPSFGTRPVS